MSYKTETPSSANPATPANGTAVGIGSSELVLLRLLTKLVADIPSIKDPANEAGAGYPPDGYDDLTDEARAVADECWQNGLDCMETALRNWIYDQREPLMTASMQNNRICDTEKQR